MIAAAAGTHRSYLRGSGTRNRIADLVRDAIDAELRTDVERAIRRRKGERDACRGRIAQIGKHLRIRRLTFGVLNDVDRRAAGADEKIAVGRGCKLPRAAHLGHDLDFETSRYV